MAMNYKLIRKNTLEQTKRFLTPWFSSLFSLLLWLLFFPYVFPGTAETVLSRLPLYTHLVCT